MHVPVISSDFEVLPGESLETSQATYADLRRRCPVAHTDSLGGFWALTRHADVARVAADYSTFTRSFIRWCHEAGVTSVASFRGGSRCGCLAAG